MALCRVCMAPITWSVDEAGEKVPIDDHEMRDYGPGRYRIVQTAVEPTVAAMAESSPAQTYVDHRVLCQQPRVI